MSITFSSGSHVSPTVRLEIEGTYFGALFSIRYGDAWANRILLSNASIDQMIDYLVRLRAGKVKYNTTVLTCPPVEEECRTQHTTKPVGKKEVLGWLIKDFSAPRSSLQYLGADKLWQSRREDTTLFSSLESARASLRKAEREDGMKYRIVRIVRTTPAQRDKKCRPGRSR